MKNKLLNDSQRPGYLAILFIAVIYLTGSNQVMASEKLDILFGEVDGQSLYLDLFLPEDVDRPDLIVYVHGGAWRRGTRKGVPIKELLNHGFAIASVDYRLSTVAPFPANVHDIKAAIRFLRANQSDLGVNADHISIIGSSAGGHLAALVGVTNNHQELEGSVGNHATTSSSVQSIVSYYGAGNLQTILSQSTPHGLSVRVPALKLLLGDTPDKKPDLAALASPVTHIEPTDPPILLIHGDQDHQMPVNQSLEISGACKKANVPCTLEIVHGGAHGGPRFYNKAMSSAVAQFIRSAHQKP